jgi:hypothetical protein
LEDADDYRKLPARWNLETVDLGRYAKLPREKVRPLWVHDYYDGVLSGALAYKGKLRWFEYCGERDDVRRYLVFELSDAEMAEEEHWHALFLEHVGDHWEVVDDKRGGTVKPVHEHAKFYEPYGQRKPPDYSGNPVLGWFEDRGELPSTRE